MSNGRLDPPPDFSDEGLGRRLASELPRYPAPARLRVSIVEAADRPARRPAWLTPLVAAAATAMALGLFMLPVLPRIAPADPVQQVVRAVVNEHSRALMWGARQPKILPADLPWLTQETGIDLRRAFAGDDRLSLVGAEPVYLTRQRGLAVHYRDLDGHLVSYIMLPAEASFTMSEQDRVQIAGRFRPMLKRDNGFVTWVWKQGDIACFLVSDMASQEDLERFKDYFVRVRGATEPTIAY
jgi:anti-sigma factor RsiW